MLTQNGEYRFQFVAKRLAPVKRVAIFAESFLPRWDGVAQTAYITLRYLQQTGREVLIFANDLAPDHIGPSQVIRLPSFSIPQAPDFHVGLPVNTIAAELKKFQPDLIHCFAPISASARGILYGRAHHIPIVSNYQTDVPQYLPYYHLNFLNDPITAWMKYLHNHSDLTLTPSHFTMDELQRTGFHNVNYWQHGVNSQHFNPSHSSTVSRQRLLNGRNSKRLLCIYVGRLANEKNIDSLHDLAKTSGLALTIIGDGPHSQALKTLFADTDTYFPGSLLGKDLASAYASADVFVFPSTTETFGLVVLEAMASGLVPVVRNSGGVTELVHNEVSGFVCQSDREFLMSVMKLRDNPALRKKLAHNARREAEKRTWDVVMSELESFYKSCLA